MWTKNINKLSLYRDALHLVKWGIDVLTSEEKDRNQLIIKKTNKVEIPCKVTLESGEKVTSMEIEFFMMHPYMFEKLSAYSENINPRKEYYDFRAMVLETFLGLKHFLYLSHFRQSKYFSENVPALENTHGNTRGIHYCLSKALSDAYDAFSKYSDSIDIELVKENQVEDNIVFVGGHYELELAEYMNHNPSVFAQRIHARNRDYSVGISYTGLEILDFVTARMKEIEADFSELDKDILPIDRFNTISEKELWARRNKSEKYII